MNIEFFTWVYIYIVYISIISPTFNNFTHLKLWVAVARHNFIWVAELILLLSTLSVNIYQAILTLSAREPSLYVRIWRL